MSARGEAEVVNSHLQQLFAAVAEQLAGSVIDRHVPPRGIDFDFGSRMQGKHC
jgi:hypothetical protein